MLKRFTVFLPALFALVMLAVLVVSQAAAAQVGPFVSADPVAIDNAPGLRSEWRESGGAPQSSGCLWVLTATTRQFFCSAASLDTTPRTLTFEGRYLWDSGIGGDGKLYIAGASGWSSPFVIPLSRPSAPTGVRLVPVVPSAAP